MPDYSRTPCPLHPSLARFCACRTSTRGTGLSPIFSVRESEYQGYPVIELLKNGGPIHKFDQHFRFGVRKAEMFLACLKSIKEFAYGTDEERRRFQSRTEQEGPQAILVYVEFRHYFDWSTGQRVEQPWLRLQSGHGYWPRVKDIGAMKCRAIWILREQIGEWFSRNDSRTTGTWEFGLGEELE